MPYDIVEFPGGMGVPTPDARPGARLQARRTTYRGECGYSITGKDNRGRRVRVFTPEGGPAPELVKANIRAGRDPFAPDDTAPTEQAHAAPPGGGTLGTVHDDEGAHRSKSVREDGTKAYNVRLTMSLVAEAMEDPRSGDLSLGGLLEELLEEFVERGRGS